VAASYLAFHHGDSDVKNTLQKAYLDWRQPYYLRVPRDCLFVVCEVNEDDTDYGSRIDEDWKRNRTNFGYVPSVTLTYIVVVYFFFSRYVLVSMDCSGSKLIPK
jgi:hypothetical protein